MIFRKKTKRLHREMFWYLIFAIFGIILILIANDLRYYLGGAIMVIVSMIALSATNISVEINDKITINYLLGRKMEFTKISNAKIEGSVYRSRFGITRYTYNQLTIKGNGKQGRIDIFFYEDQDGLVREIEQVLGKSIENKERLNGPVSSCHSKKLFPKFSIVKWLKKLFNM